jgi:hypothetical protein
MGLFAPKDNGCPLHAEGWTMQEFAPQQKRSFGFDEVDRDAQLKQVLDSLESENGQLKELVVRLSETILRIVTAKR